MAISLNNNNNNRNFQHINVGQTFDDTNTYIESQLNNAYTKVFNGKNNTSASARSLKRFICSDINETINITPAFSAKMA